jgi:putative ABC transport system permease protein
MTPGETARMALRQLARHRVRSALATLGIVFGVGAVISMLSIGEGARRQTLEQIRLLGLEIIRVRSVKPPALENAPERESWVFTYGVTLEEVRRLRRALPDIERAVPVRDLRSDVRAGRRKGETQVLATTADFLQAVRCGLRDGRFLLPSDETESRRVCVLGAGARRKLFPLGEALGQFVQVDAEFFRVVGVLEDVSAAAGRALQGIGVQDGLFIPYQTFLSRFGSTTMKGGQGTYEAIRLELDEVLLKVSDAGKVEGVAAAVRRALETRHDRADWEVSLPLELLRQSRRTQRTFNLVMGSIAGISLLVGGIGVMNIMLANVVERTREIGTRRALGARRKDILFQFLAESAALCCLGGAAGILLGAAGAWAIARAASWPTVVPLWAVVPAFFISAAVGVGFGTYPAWKAAALDPVEALRQG